MPRISVIIPVYKVEAYLHECVDSILNQTFDDFELILVDDGSPDNCPIICDEYAKKDSRVIVIHKTNGGLSSARNAGLDYILVNSNSEYISFVDSDDYVDVLYLETMVKAAIENSSDIVISGYEAFYTDGRSRLNLPVDLELFNFDKYGIWTHADKKIRASIVISCAKLFRKNLFSGCRFEEGKISEDELIIHYLFHQCDIITCLPKALYYYRQNRPCCISSTFKATERLSRLLYEFRRVNFLISNNYPFDCFKNLSTSMAYDYSYNCLFENNKEVKQLFRSNKKMLLSKRYKIDFKTKTHLLFPSLICLFRFIVNGFKRV